MSNAERGSAYKTSTESKAAVGGGGGVQRDRASYTNMHPPRIHVHEVANVLSHGFI